MKKSSVLFLIFSFSAAARFPEDVVFGPGMNSEYFREYPLARLSGQLHVSGDYMDFEADVFSASAFLNRDLTRTFGISWYTFLALPVVALRKHSVLLNSAGIVLLGMNAVLNMNVSFGNSWIRGFMGWKNDVFLFRKALWIFNPVLGCKCALPEWDWAGGSIRGGIAFPSFLSNGMSGLNNPKNFKPRLFLGVDFYIIFTELYLSVI